MFININNLPEDIKWLNASDFKLMIIAAKYCENENIRHIKLNEDFKKFCKHNGLDLELSTINQKFSYFNTCKIASKLGVRDFALNDNIFIH